MDRYRTAPLNLIQRSSHSQQQKLLADVPAFRAFGFVSGHDFSRAIPRHNSPGFSPRVRTPEFGKSEGRTADPSVSLGMTILFGNAKYSFQDKLPSRPERTRISCHAALDEAACAPFRKEGRMKCTDATKFHRKSGVAERRDLRCAPRASQILEFSRRLFSPNPFAPLRYD